MNYNLTYQNEIFLQMKKRQTIKEAYSNLKSEITVHYKSLNNVSIEVIK